MGHGARVESESEVGAPPRAGAAPSDRLDFLRGLALALPLSLLFWIAVVRLAWGLWRG